MRTMLAMKLTQSSAIPHLRAHTHDLPGFPDITCIDFVNDGNKDVPPTLQNIMLVPDGTQAPNLGRDRTLYTVPADYTEAELRIDLGVVGEKDFVVAQLIIKTSEGESISHTHVPCELL